MYSIRKIVDLSKFGWTDCSLIFKSLSYNELQELKATYKNADTSDDKVFKDILDFLKDKFVSGTVLDDNEQKQDLKAEDIGKLPFEVVEEVVSTLTGANQDPK